MLSPPFPYGGGKARLAKWIRSLLPVKEGYCEPFAGMLSVLLAGPPAEYELVNDLNGDLHAWWTAVRDHPDELQARLDATPLKSRPHFVEARSHLNSDDVLTVLDRAYAYALLLANSYSGDGQNWGRTYPMNKKYGWPRLGALAERLMKVEIECVDAVVLLERIARFDYQVVYVDPPYWSSWSPFQKDMSSVDVEALTEVLLKQKGAVALSGYEGEWNHLEDEGWRSVPTPTIPTSFRGDVPGRRRERLWTNFEPGGQQTLV